MTSEAHTGTARLPQPDTRAVEGEELIKRLREAASLAPNRDLLFEAADLLTRLAAVVERWKDECREWESDAITAQAELTSLKARVADVLGPFKKAAADWMTPPPPDLPDDYELNIMGITVGDFRRAASLHAELESGARSISCEGGNHE